MKNLLGFSSTTVGIAVVNFLSIMILTRLFTPDDYGYANLLMSYSVILSTILTLSLDQVIMHYFYEFNIRSMFKNAKIYIIMLVILLVILGFFASMYTYLPYQDILMILLYSLALIFNRVYMVIFRMNRSIIHYFAQGIGIKVTEIFLIIILAMFFGSEYYFIVIPYIISVILINFFQFVNIGKIIKKSNEKYPAIDASKQFQFAIPLMITILMTTLLQNIDKIILNMFVSDQNLGLYYAAFKVIGVITIFYTIVSLVWTPIAIKISQKSHYKNFISDSISLFQFSSLIILLIFITFQGLIGFILGPTYAESIYLLTLLIGMPLFMLISEPYSTLITTSKRTKYHVYITATVLFFSLITTFILAYFYGVIGASHAILINYFFLYLCRLIASSKIIKYKKNTILEIVISLLILILTLLAYHLSLKVITLLIIFSIAILIFIFNNYKYKRVIKIILEDN